MSVSDVREHLLPRPLVVLRALGGNEISWAGHLWITTLENVGAFIVAGVVGVALGIVMAWSPVLANALVQMHGGTIEAPSAGAGQRAIFTIRLPQIPEPARPHGS